LRAQLPPLVISSVFRRRIVIADLELTNDES